MQMLIKGVFVWNRNLSGFKNGPSERPRLAVNNKENKVGIHFLSLRVGGPPAHIRAGLVASRSRGLRTETGSRAPPARAPLSSAGEGAPRLGACSAAVCCS